MSRCPTFTFQVSIMSKWLAKHISTKVSFKITIRKAFPIGVIQVSTPRKWIFLLYFSSLHDYWPPTSLIWIVHNSLGEMKWFEKRTFQLLKMRKMKVSWNIKTMCVTDILLTVRSSSMKDYTCHYVVST